MQVDICYNVEDEDIYKYVRQNVGHGEIPLAIYSASDDLYINKKNMWNIYDVLRSDGVLAVQTPLWNIGCVTNAAESICGNKHDFDIVIFYNDAIGGRCGTCFYESCIPFVLVYKQHLPIAWALPEPANIYNSRPNIIPCTPDLKESSHDMIDKFLSITEFRDVILLAGSKSNYYAKYIKDRCRYIVAFGYDPFSGIHDEGIRVENL